MEPRPRFQEYSSRPPDKDSSAASDSQQGVVSRSPRQSENGSASMRWLGGLRLPVIVLCLIAFGTAITSTKQPWFSSTSELGPTLSQFQEITVSFSLFFFCDADRFDGVVQKFAIAYRQNF